MFCFSKCCRLCLTKNSTLANIKCSGLDRISCLDKLGLLAPSLVANPRNYVIWICEQCRKRLNKAYTFIQNCFKSDAVLDEYYTQLINADTAQNKCKHSDVSDIQLIENLIQESIPRSFKEECFEDLPPIDDDQYYFESSITIIKHEVSPGDFEVKLEPSELKQEAGFNVGDDPTSNDEIIVSEYDRDQPENVEIDPLAGTSSENNITSCSDVPIDAKDCADNCNLSSSNSLTKYRGIAIRKHLKQHTMVLSGERPYECNICKKTFRKSSNLNQHRRLHTGERPYECKICNKKFAHSSDVKKHGKIHSGERPYECKICNKKFAHSGDVKRHGRIHSGERPYECKICNKKFARSSNVKIHQRIHTHRRKAL